MNKEITVFDLCSKVQKAMLDKAFSSETIRRYETVFNEFIIYSGNSVYSQALGTSFLVDKLSELGGLPSTDDNSHVSKTYNQTMHILAEYYNFGILHYREDCIGEIIWPEGFRKCMNEYLADMVASGLSRGYYLNTCTTLHSLILFLDDRGVHTPDEIKVGDNDAFISTLTGLCSKSLSMRLCYLRRFYRFLFLHEYIQAPLAERLPKACIQGRTTIPTVWTDEEISKIKESAERVSPEGKRSYAMILLAAELGLRIGDIRSLKLSEIDWERKELNIIQNKTGHTLCLPMTDSVGWALIDYLKNGRPVSESSFVFVKHRPPYDEFPVNTTLHGLLSKVLVKADIPPVKKENVGWHTFRRSLATNLLQHKVPMNTITEILGHADPEIAGRHYIQISIENLKNCTLCVEVKDYVC